MLYDLTIEEYALVREFRAKKLRDFALKEKQKHCKHEFRYTGHSHNDDCYECKICGKMEWR